MYIIPNPQKITLEQESFSYSGSLLTCDDEKIKSFADFNLPLFFNKIESDKAEFYSIISAKDGVYIKYGDIEGAYRACATLDQIVAQCGDTFPKIEIEDWPAIKNRGYMLDISRGKIPNIEELYKLIDRMSALKYNQLQLYLDSFPVAYKNYPEYTKDTEPLTLNELIELNEYAKAHFVKLVPNQNTFGHMKAWTQKPEIAPLAITGKDGEPSQTLNPLNPKTIDFIDSVFDGYIDIFDSDIVNVGMDETVDLGKNETKEECDKLGVGKVYTNYLNKICDLVSTKYHMTPMFWDDIIFKHPEELDNIPKNAIVGQWGYEQEHQYDRNCRRISERGLRFYVCPGTSMWGSFTGRTDNAVFNIWNAAECGAYYGAEGFLLTEWGDDGFPQFTSTSYFPFVFGGAVSWNILNHSNEFAYDPRNKLIDECKEYLNDFLYDAHGTDFAEIVYRMGNYYLLDRELHFNGTKLYHYTMNPDQIPEGKASCYGEIAAYMTSLREKLAKIDADPQAKEEILLNCDMVIALASVIANGKSDYTDFEISRIQKEYKTLWLKSNHEKGVELFINILEKAKR